MAQHYNEGRAKHYRYNATCVFLLTQLIERFHLPIQLWAPDGSVLYTNARFNELFGMEQLYDWKSHGRSLITDPQLTSCGVSEQCVRALHGKLVELHSLRYQPERDPKSKNYQRGELQLFMTLMPLTGQDGSIAGVVCIVSEHAVGGEHYESQMMRIQKMENLEILASGVAHEFNNIFTGIKGLTDLIRDEVDATSEIYEFALAIQQNIARGADLIQQLSTFAREMPHSLRRRMISDYITDALPLMRMQVQRRITIETDIRADGPVLIDHNRMDQALANVLHNARDAMGGQGKVLIAVDRAAPQPRPGLDLGDVVEWIMIEVADSGQGISDELKDRVLEPFFSTKERGKATGLGLSVTNRIVVSHGGVLQIGNSAELGGAAIRVFLPMLSGNDAAGT